MQKFCIRIAFVLVLISFFAVDCIAQPPVKAKERIQQLKKIKLLEILNLDEKQAESFLIKYTSIEKKIEEKKVNLDIAIEDLELTIRKNSSKDEIKSKTQKVEISQSEFMKSLDESRNSVKSILNEENYAKFLIFEHKFKDEVQKILMKKMKDKKNKNND